MHLSFVKSLTVYTASLHRLVQWSSQSDKWELGFPLDRDGNGPGELFPGKRAGSGKTRKDSRDSVGTVNAGLGKLSVQWDGWSQSRKKRWIPIIWKNYLYCHLFIILLTYYLLSKLIIWYLFIILSIYDLFY